MTTDVSSRPRAKGLRDGASGEDILVHHGDQILPKPVTVDARRPPGRRGKHGAGHETPRRNRPHLRNGCSVSDNDPMFAGWRLSQDCGGFIAKLALRNGAHRMASS